MIPPTVRQATRISNATPILEVFTASQAIWSSKLVVKRASWRAQGTAATTAP
jgi:hypothetical protein